MKFSGIKTYQELEDTINLIINKIRNKEFIHQQEFYLLKTIDDLIENLVLEPINKRRKELQVNTLGHGFINFYGDDISPGCKLCLFEKELGTIRSVSDCNLRCSFCYYNNIHHLDRKLQPEHFVINDREVTLDEIKIMIDKQKIDGISWVYKEPFMDIEKHYEPIKYIHDKGIYQFMYTNGTLCTKDNLDKLAQAGLDELRFDLAATHCSDYVLDMMEYATTIFPWVGIESPMYKEYYESFLAKKDRIKKSGIKFINCAELHLDINNQDQIIDNLENMYTYKSGYVSPVDSRMYTYDMIELAIKEKWDFTIHDCSNTTKVYRGYNSKNPFGVLAYSDKEALPLEWYPIMLKKHKDYLQKFLDV